VISVLVLFRNAPRLAEQCLQAIRACGLRDAEYVLVDDCSDSDRAVLPALESFRRGAAPAGTRIVRFKRQMHYGHGIAYAMSLARGEQVLFVSHDMIVTPDCIAELLDVAAGDKKIGVVRPTSEHMDWAKSFAIAPPAPVQSADEAFKFSADVRRHFGSQAVDWPMLIGDAMLIRRSVIDRIGVFDTRFYGFMGDIDYGIRLHRAGFRHVIARGAWLHHEGNGTAKAAAAAGDSTVQEQGRKMVQQVESAYALFRQKWGESNLPPHFREMKRPHFEALHALGRMTGDEIIPPLVLTDDIGELV
jgi:GT2 family glycosyltransferase